MKIEFSDGEDGVSEAQALSRIAENALENFAEDPVARQMARTLIEYCIDFDAHAPTRATGENLSWWRRLMGPSHREEILSAQRVAALERAERAERSSFEALAETARVARERDEARAKIAELERTVEDNEKPT